MEIQEKHREDWDSGYKDTYALVQTDKLGYTSITIMGFRSEAEANERGKREADIFSFYVRPTTVEDYYDRLKCFANQSKNNAI